MFIARMVGEDCIWNLSKHSFIDRSLAMPGTRSEKSNGFFATCSYSKYFFGTSRIMAMAPSNKPAPSRPAGPNTSW